MSFSMPFSYKLICMSATIEEAFHALNANQLGIVFVGDEKGCVVGCLTDGDIRRQLLRRDDISTPVSSFMNRDFQHVAPGTPREHILKLLDHRVRVVPVLDSDGKLVRIYTRDSFEIQEEAETFARARAPARISFAGGGTDLTHFFLKEGGVV